MVIRHSREEIALYKNTDALNQTLIKELIKNGIDQFLLKEEQLKTNGEDEYEEKEHFLIGHAVDHYFSFGRDEFENDYYLSRLIEKPKDTPLKILKRAFAKASGFGPVIGPIYDYQREIWEACNEEAYYMNRYKPNWEEDTRPSSVIQDNGAAYWNDLKASNGKQVLTTEEDGKIRTIIQSFETHPHTSFILNEQTGACASDDFIVIFQTPLYFTYNEILCKALIDYIVVDLQHRTIIIGDIKTTMEDILNFNRAIKRHRYDLQASFYMFAIGENVEYLSKLTGVNLNGFSFSKFGFITETTKNPGTPMIFVMDDIMIETGRRGDSYLLGWEQGIERFKLWKQVDFSKEDFFGEAHGIVEVGHNFNYLRNF